MTIIGDEEMQQEYWHSLAIKIKFDQHEENTEQSLLQVT